MLLVVFHDSDPKADRVELGPFAAVANSGSAVLAMPPGAGAASEVLAYRTDDGRFEVRHTGRVFDCASVLPARVEFVRAGKKVVTDA